MLQLHTSCLDESIDLPLKRMGKYETVLAKLLNRESTITYQEISYLLGKLGYVENHKGRTSGSRVAFINKERNHIIRLHKPHPGNELKRYVKREIISALRDKKMI